MVFATSKPLGLLVFGPFFEHRVLAGFKRRGQFRFFVQDEILGIPQRIPRLALEIAGFLGEQFPRFLAGARRVQQRGACPDERANRKRGEITAEAT